MTSHLNPFFQGGWGNENPNARTGAFRGPMAASPANQPPAAVTLYFKRVDEKRLCYNVFDHEGRLRFVVSTDDPNNGFTNIRTAYGTPMVVGSLEWMPAIPVVDFPHLRASRMYVPQWLPPVGEEGSRRMIVGNNSYVWKTVSRDRHTLYCGDKATVDVTYYANEEAELVFSSTVFYELHVPCVTAAVLFLNERSRR